MNSQENSRRRFLVLACGILATGAAEAQLTPNIVALRKAAHEEAIRKVLGGAQARPGRVKLDLPPLIENGNSVPLTVTVQSPMTAADHVKAIHVFTEKNPQPNIISAWLGPRAGRAAVTTRARIADTGTVTAIAQLSDGSFWSDRVDVVVTLSACLEDGPT
jgi:sulfur-oxidizing protein SoxY